MIRPHVQTMLSHFETQPERWEFSPPDFYTFRLHTYKEYANARDPRINWSGTYELHVCIGVLCGSWSTKDYRERLYFSEVRRFRRLIKTSLRHIDIANKQAAMLSIDAVLDPNEPLRAAMARATRQQDKK